MTFTEGFSIIESAVSGDLARQLAKFLEQELPLRAPGLKGEKYSQYDIQPPLALQIKEEFINNAENITVVAELLQKSVAKAPDYISIGIFHETDADPTKLKTAGEGRVYATIALTDLGPNNGWFAFFEGSHKQKKSPLKGPTTVNMKAGDAFVWRGELVYHHSSGGGGMFETLVYR
ncbi:hypothetical protein PAAG_00048 [Paracoccidioides lutzii Pb01]|uniref:Uncharacterized protein n=1 Tax=Paracoccidioides lutzii (strain ATCC MYA-826 / Pb01) TaxID=502779 RepID=C1GNF3_PARBA|nr:hypothetical protein PAAG_00048 [Paracoccidioides lutzii Pb01]EEH35725.1 hypothetical protein PAAG_00048 [Paracoccidioides lutzii Pb01]